MSRRWRRRLRAFLLLAAGLLLAATAASPLLIRDDGPQPADAIIVIGGDHKPERIQHAAELYRQGYATVVILSAGTQVFEGTERIPEAEVLRRQALAAGLPADALLLEDQSQSTFQNAYYTRALCQARGFTSVLLVPLAYQSRRAGRIFQDVYGDEISLRVQAAPPRPCSVCWWFQPDQVPVVFYEYYNWGRYWIGLRLANEMPAP